MMKPISKYTDLSYLTQLANGNNEFICQMITIFLQQTPTALEDMEKFMDQKDWTAMRKAAHKIKPSFVFMGIQDLERDVRRIEEFCLSQTHLEELPLMLKEIKLTCELAFDELRVEKRQYC